NIYVSMNVDRLLQLLKGVLKDHMWEWMVDFLKDLYGAEKALEVIKEQFFALPRFSYICQFGNKLTQVKQWTSSEYKDMLKVWLAALAPLFKGHPNYFKFLTSVTDFILVAGYHSHTDSTLRYLQNVLHSISRIIHLFLPYRHNQSISKIPKIHCLFHYIECIKKIGSTDNSDTDVSDAAHNNLIKDSYRASNKVDYIPQMLQW
ncbi:hypothetical protein K440DRAFT_504296, partial [Wilcoxina mikolae CBS 423.85]